MSFKKCPRPEMIPATRADKAKASKGKTHKVTFPVSYRYNGLIEVDGKLYEGFDVPRPKVPKGWEIVNIGVGLQLNARPPYATVALKPKVA